MPVYKACMHFILLVFNGLLYFSSFLLYTRMPYLETFLSIGLAIILIT